jgi:DHA2 family multidrug resistance protein
MVIMPLLMMSTNTVTGPAEGPFASALINTSRAMAEAASAWFFELIDRRRNALHFNRLADEVGQDRWRVIQGNGVLPQYPAPLTPGGRPRVPGSLEAFGHALQQQVTILSASDTFLILGALSVFLMLLVMTLPVRTMPPRIHFATH